MGIYIEDMVVPKSCGECLGIGWHYVFECNIDDVEEGEKLSTCPLFSVPPHGRLIDADALKPGFIGSHAYTNWSRYAVINAPTIIEADGDVANGSL